MTTLFALLVWLLAVVPPLQAEDLVPGYWEQTPLPQTGLATFYAPGMMEHVLDVRAALGQRLVCPECVGTVALLRAGDIGRKVWLQPLGGERVGPFLVIDCARREDVWPLLERNWVVDVSYELGEIWAMDRPLDGMTVSADPADEGFSDDTVEAPRAPTPFYVAPEKIVVTAPTATPVTTPTPLPRPTRWPTRLPSLLAGGVTLPAAERAPNPTPAGPLPPTPLTPVITTPTPRARTQVLTGTPIASGSASTPPAPPSEPAVAVGRAGQGLLLPTSTPLPGTPISFAGSTATPTAPAAKRVIPSVTSVPILPSSGLLALPTPRPDDEPALLRLLRSLLQQVRP